MTDLQPDWRQRKKAATRDRIRASALRLFGEQGYDATTVEQIAAAAGSAFLHGMSTVMLSCAAITALAALTSLRYLPGRAAPGAGSPQRAPGATAPPASTRR